ncbi:MAG TPA: hypothetical protein VEY06_02840 [Flavisolibacter sp.]|nr:hypothetical protein [Flavisolibacter sp.]
MGLNLRETSREEFEVEIIDVVRFEHAEAYLDAGTLHFFKDERLKELFIQIFYVRPATVLQVLDNAEASAGSTYRFKEVRETVMTKWFRDGKLTGI